MRKNKNLLKKMKIIIF